MIKRSITVVRTLAILAGCAILFAGCDRTNQTESEAPARTANTPTVGAAPAVADSTVQKVQPADPPSEAADTKVIAYYFHRTLRCPTCLSIEAQAREAIVIGFSKEIEDGQLEWQAVDIEQEGNEHFESDFELSSSSLVIVEMRGNEVAQWKNLERVWELVEDPLGFQVYVWDELMKYLPG
ncbi:MAG: nitrophenyl compound nitroreductase subunit ArsF family protein [Planctomycetota bacterium]